MLSPSGRPRAARAGQHFACRAAPAWPIMGVPTHFSATRRLLAGATSLATLALAMPAVAATADDTGSGNADDIVVTATKVNKSTPITASIHTFEPQAIISRSIIEDSVPATADFSDVILLTPGASGTSNGGGPGLSESKTVLRGFQDGQFNIT